MKKFLVIFLSVFCFLNISADKGILVFYDSSECQSKRKLENSFRRRGFSIYESDKLERLITISLGEYESASRFELLDLADAEIITSRTFLFDLDSYIKFFSKKPDSKITIVTFGRAINFVLNFLKRSELKLNNYIDGVIAVDFAKSIDEYKVSRSIGSRRPKFLQELLYPYFDPETGEIELRPVVLDRRDPFDIRRVAVVEEDGNGAPESSGYYTDYSCTDDDSGYLGDDEEVEKPLVVLLTLEQVKELLKQDREDRLEGRSCCTNFCTPKRVDNMIDLGNAIAKIILLFAS